MIELVLVAACAWHDCRLSLIVQPGFWITSYPMSAFLPSIVLFSNQRQHAIAFSDCLVEHSAGGRACLVEQRLIALSPSSPIVAMALINDEVGTAEACRGAAFSLAWCGAATAACRLGLEHAPAVVAGVNAK